MSTSTANDLSLECFTARMGSPLLRLDRHLTVTCARYIANMPGSSRLTGGREGEKTSDDYGLCDNEDRFTHHGSTSPPQNMKLPHVIRDGPVNNV